MIGIGVVDFQDPTLLIAGDAFDIKGLASLIASSNELTIRNGDLYKLRGIQEIDITYTQGRSSFESTKGGIRWRLSNPERTRISALLHDLASSDAPAHSYLDPENNLSGFEVVASVGEYIVESVLQWES